MKPIAPNTLLQDRYLIVHLIGKGGMGEVYLAVDQRLGSAVALKRTFFADDQLLGGAFEREARTLARLRHNVLPKVSDHFTEEGNQYLIMDHISGEDLSKRLENSKKPFPLNWVLFWADQLLDALNYLHTNEPPIIHRDIKPQNLKLTDENSIVLLDFGLSKNSLDVSHVSSSTTGSIVGYTPHYAPMEQIRGTGTNARSDLYSLSSTLYQLLTNQVPPDALSRADALLSGMSDPIKPINEINPEVSSIISGVILKGMEVSQDKRFSNAREMQKALRDAYAQMQSQIAAQTTAFNIQSQPEVAEVSKSKSKSSVNKIPSTGKTKVSNSKANIENDGNPFSTSANNEQNAKDFDTSLDSEPKQKFAPANESNVETEVLTTDSIPGIAEAREEFSDSKENNRNKKVDGEEIFGETENLSNNATIPSISLLSENSENDESPAIDNPASSADYQSDSYATFVPGKNNSHENFQTKTITNSPHLNDYLPVVQNQVVNKKSGGKLPFAAGGIGLLILAISAAGIGLFMLNSSKPISESTPTPTPEATMEIKPTPMPTVESTANTYTESNTASETLSNANPDTAVSNSNKTVVEKSSEASNGVSKTAQPTPVRINPKPPIVSTAESKSAVKPTPASKKPQPTPLPRILP